MIDPKKITNPFPGLRPFETDEYGLFFGREGQSDALIEKLQRSHFLAVVGTSGSGKSSLVRAGLLPALRGGMMAGAGSGWRIAIMRPGNDPIGNLACALAKKDVLLEAGGSLPPAEAQAVIEATLRRGALGLVEAAKQARLQDHEKLLVVVDQFEELFRFRATRPVSSTGDDASAFVKLLLEAAQQDEQSIYIVPTMRSDFLGDCAQFQGLPEAINDGQYLIPRMTRDERRFAITGPVGVKRCKITESLVNQLMNDVGDNPDQLPILQHALMRTWDYWAAHRHDGEPIGLEHYEAIGTMADALSLHADEAFNELPDARSKVVAESLFKALTERGADNREIRRPTSLENICAIANATAQEVITVIEVFRGGGRSFLMVSADELKPQTVIDISHESLIRNWRRLKEWVNEEAQSARIYRRVAEAAALHREGSEGLAQDPGLQLALDWREKSKPNAAWARRYDPEFEESIRYLNDSSAARDAAVAERERQRNEEMARERRELETARAFAEKQARSAKSMRRLTAALCVFLVIALGALVVAFVLQRRAVASREQARAALTRNFLIREGLEALGRNHSSDALKSFDCLSQNLQSLLPQAPHLPAWSDYPCQPGTVNNDKSGQLEIQLAWAYTNLGNTLNSIADDLDNSPTSDSTSADAPAEAPTKTYYSRALDAYEMAVKILDPLVKNDDSDRLNAYHGLGQSYHNVALKGYEPPQGSHKEPLKAEEYFQKADETYQQILKIQEQHIDKDPADAAAEHTNLAHLYRDMRKDGEAEQHFRQSAQLWERAARIKGGGEPEEDSSNEEIKVLKEVAEFFTSLNRFNDAEEAYDQVIDIQENYAIERGQEVADSYSELGQIYEALNDREKAAAAFRLANVLPQLALKSRRNETASICTDLIKLPPLYFRLERYYQVKQVHDIALFYGGPCAATMRGVSESLLNRALGKLATRDEVDPAKNWEDEDGIYDTLTNLLPASDSAQAEKIFSRRLNNLSKRFDEVTNQPDAAKNTRFIKAYLEALTTVAGFYQEHNADQLEATYRLAFNALDLVKASNELGSLDTGAALLESYGRFLVDHKRPDEAAKVNEAAKDLRQKQDELEKKPHS